MVRTPKVNLSDPNLANWTVLSKTGLGSTKSDCHSHLMKTRLFSPHFVSQAAPFLFSKSGVMFVDVASVPNGLIEMCFSDASRANCV